MRGLLTYGCVGVALGLTFGFDSRPSAEVPRSAELRPVRTELEQVVDELTRDGLPVELVVHKVREGEAKGIGPVRVLAAARGVAADVRLADRIVRKYYSRPKRRAQIIHAAVAAHRAGVPLSGVDRIMGAAARVEPAVSEAALYAAADLSGRGYEAGRAVELVVALTQRAQRSEELPRALAVVEAVRGGTDVPRGTALDAVVVAVEAGADLASVSGAALFESARKQR